MARIQISLSDEISPSNPLQRDIEKDLANIKSPFAYCPECNAVKVMSERRINGDSTCANNHVHPTRSFLPSFHE